MIVMKSGDLLQSDAQALVNTVNCVGVMGKGVALAFKQKFPHNFSEYKKACDRKEVVIGRMFVQPHPREPNRWIINFPTKQHWKDPSQYEWIQLGLLDLMEVLWEKRITSIAMPYLGCGNGGLNWAIVIPMIEKAFDSFKKLEVQIYSRD